MGVAPIKGTSLLANMGRGAFADALFDPEGGNLSTLLVELGISNDVIALLDSKVGEDAEAAERLTGRLKQAVEGAGLGIPIDLAVSAFRAARSDEGLTAAIKGKLQAVGERLNQPGEMPPTSSFGASEIDKLLMDKSNSVNINSAEDFAVLAAKGELRTARTTKQDIADIVKKKMLATVINVRAADDKLSMQYETGKITQKLKDAGLFVDDDGMGIIHVGTTQENLDAIKQAKTPLEIGRLSGYSEEDIAAFYLKRRGGAKDIAFEEYKTDRESL
jgi:hypothetical protein